MRDEPRPKKSAKDIQEVLKRRSGSPAPKIRERREESEGTDPNAHAIDVNHPSRTEYRETEPSKDGEICTKIPNDPTPPLHHELYRANGIPSLLEPTHRKSTLCNGAHAGGQPGDNKLDSQTLQNTYICNQEFSCESFKT